MSYHDRDNIISTKICSLFYSLKTSTYDEVAPKIEYWIECALTEQLTTIDKLVEQVSVIAWTNHDFHASARFLKGFRDAPHRSEQAKLLVDELCARAFRWFLVASAEDFSSDLWDGRIWSHGGKDPIQGVPFVGHLIEYDLLNHELVRRHLVKSLIAHHYTDRDTLAEAARARVIYQLFSVVGKTLLQGLLEPEDVRVCFEILDAQRSRPEGIVKLDETKLEVQCATPPDAPIGTY